MEQSDKIIIEDEKDIKIYHILVANISDIMNLVDRGFFSFKGGSYTVHRDADGKMRKIDRNDTVYKG